MLGASRREAVILAADIVAVLWTKENKQGVLMMAVNPF